MREEYRCAVCKTSWSQLCEHAPTPTAADHAKFSNPMTHFIYLSTGLSPMSPVPQKPSTPQKEEQ